MLNQMAQVRLDATMLGAETQRMNGQIGEWKYRTHAYEGASDSITIQWYQSILILSTLSIYPLTANEQQDRNS